MNVTVAVNAAAAAPAAACCCCCYISFHMNCLMLVTTVVSTSVHCIPTVWCVRQEILYFNSSPAHNTFHIQIYCVFFINIYKGRSASGRRGVLRVCGCVVVSIFRFLRLMPAQQRCSTFVFGSAPGDHPVWYEGGVKW